MVTSGFIGYFTCLAINDKLKLSSIESTDAEEDEKGVLVLSSLGLFAGDSFLLGAGDPILNLLSRAAASDKFGVEVRFFWSDALVDVDDENLSNGGRTLSSLALSDKRLEDSTTIDS